MAGYYFTGTKDINTIFDSANPQSVTATGVKQNGQDLSQIYTPLGYNSWLYYPNPTNLFSGPYNKDLSEIFALKLILPSSTATHYTFKTGSLNSYPGIILLITGSGTINFNYGVTSLQLDMIGGGAGGGARQSSNAGGGGGGGQWAFGTITAPSGGGITSLSCYVGAGGAGATEAQGPVTGGVGFHSSVTYTTNPATSFNQTYVNGGGGGGSGKVSGANGGSGIVIIRYTI